MLRPEPVIRPELKPVVLVDNDAPSWGVVLVLRTPGCNSFNVIRYYVSLQSLWTSYGTWSYPTSIYEHTPGNFVLYNVKIIMRFTSDRTMGRRYNRRECCLRLLPDYGEPRSKCLITYHMPVLILWTNASNSGISGSKLRGYFNSSYGSVINSSWFKLHYIYLRACNLIWLNGS